MSRGWRREAAERKRLRSDDDRATLERRIAEAVAEDAHAAGHHVAVANGGCPSCRRSERRPRAAPGLF